MSESMQRKTKLGLVLSGGGAKGAYEAGVIKALSKLGCEPEVVAGASIGAVNGAIVACAENLKAASEDLDLVWKGIDPDVVIKTKMSRTRIWELAAYRLLLAKALSITAFGSLAMAVGNLIAEKFFTEDDEKVLSLLDRAPLEEILSKTVDFNKLHSENARELFVALFPASNENGDPSVVGSILKYAASKGESKFFRVNDFDPGASSKLIMASASFPIAFHPVKIGDTWYYDGGMGDRVKAQGNTPVQPIEDAGCTHAIIVMLDNGVLWDRAEWPNLTAIAIRPSIDMGGLFEAFDFSPSKISMLMELGEKDAMDQVGKVLTTLSSYRQYKQSEISLKKALDDMNAPDAEYDGVMAKIDDLLST